MPISAKELEEKGKEVGTGPRETRASQVLDFLKDNQDNAFTQKEVGKEVGINSTHANSVLGDLVKKGSVRRKEYTVDGKPLIHYAFDPKSEEEEEA